MTARVVIAGAALGGARTAGHLRDRGFDGELVMVDPDPAAPYDRPPLSKQVLTGSWQPGRASLGDPVRQWGVDRRVGAVAEVDPASRTLALDTGESLAYDWLVVATGATPRTLPDPVGRSLDGVHALRTLADCMALRKDLARDGPLVVVGGGFIGAEVASAARTLGVPTTIVDPLPAPMSRALGDEVGALLSELHTSKGVDVHCGVGVDAVTGSRRVEEVVLEDGRALPADSVVVGIGVTPNTGCLDSSGLRIDDGVVCDQYCAADEAGTVYAVGDVARWYNTAAGRHIRIEHWSNATEQAATVAHNIAHPQRRRAHVAVPYFWSDQHGAKIQLVGHVDATSEVQMLRRPGGKDRLVAVYHHDDALRAALTVNWPRGLAAARRAIAARTSTTHLLDELTSMS